MRKRVILGVAAMGYQRIVIATIQLLIIPVLAVHWGLALYGQWLMLSAIPIFLATSDFGFSIAAGNRIIAEVAKGDREEALISFQSALKVILMICSAILIVAMLAIATIPGDILATDGGMAAPNARLALAILSAYGLCTLQTSLFQAVARSAGKQAVSITIEATIQLVEGAAVAATAILGGSPPEVAICYLVVRAGGLVTHVAYARRCAPWLAIGFARSSKERVSELLRPAIAAMVLPLGNAIYLQGTSIALGMAGGVAIVPLFTSLRTLARSCRQVMMALVTSLMPEYTVAWAHGDTRLLRRIAGGVITAYSIAGPLLALVVGVVGLDILALWTKDVIQPPQAMVTWVAVGLAMTIVWNAIGDLLLAINRHETYSYVYLGCALIGIALTFALVPPLGVTGAALANIPLEVIMLVTTLVSIRRTVGPPELGVAPLLAVVPDRWRSKLRFR